MERTPPDPAAFFRDMLGQWEKTVNSLGGEAMRSEEFSRSMGAATAATATMQANMQQMTEKALAAANLPTRSDFDAMAGRIAAIEASLARIEAQLGTSRSDPDKPRPTRGRKPPVAPQK
ncbi:poly(R)-hydroxyalkanoic acid synthase subunit PhaE [Sphingomonas sp. TZW2008]|uniref:poly(R)-hydroxyalkanoic acid synthase subunit PhaE n=1 Tax=Sphingomonas sp. TZW2008 TaxID=1917973 RepID=UPI0011818E13|nr:poly(R)-hydroxyalkanoic acid synthase subunit PhaE [Sphingomonas sp. TZW2008]